MDRFTNLYPLSKTLRFELKPIGKTEEFIIKNGILNQDQHRADSYKEVKKIIDNYHRSFIETSLSDYFADKDNSEKFIKLLNDYNECQYDDDKKAIDNSRKLLRKLIASAFSDNEKYKNLFTENLIKTELLEFVKTENEKKIISEFNRFTTYFVGFHENRKNIYSNEDKSTAISYRLIHENLPKFIDNISIYDKVKTAISIDDIVDELRTIIGNQSLEEIFSLHNYVNVLTQSQIDNYNTIIGGIAEEGRHKIKGLNEYINLYNQQQKDKSKRLPKFKNLYKQILCDRNSSSWLPAQFQSDNELLETIEIAYRGLIENVINPKNQHSIIDIMERLSDYNLEKIFIKNDLQLTNISQRIYGDYGIIAKALIEELKRNSQINKKEKIEKYEERINKLLDSQASISIAQIDYCLSQYDIDLDNNLNVCNYFATEIKEIVNNITSAYNDAKDLLNTDYPENRKLLQDDDSIEKIKVLLDSIKDLQRFIKPLLGDGDEQDRDLIFYGEFNAMWEAADRFTTLYNMVRNYLTRKPYSTDKIKLNFENPTLVKGWDLNKERDNTTVILRKDGKYYLAIMDKNHNKVMDVDNLSTDGECFQKMEYKYFKDLTTMVPKCTTQLKDVKKHFETTSTPYYIKSNVFASPFEITKEEYELNNVLIGGKKKFQIDYLKATGDTVGYKDALKKWIKFCLRFISQYKSTMVYNVSSKKYEDKIDSYPSLDIFYAEINLELYKLSFRNVSVNYISKLVDEGKLYLFQIYSKDFSEYSKGTPNMHTLYWKALFDEDNLKNVVYKLNGEAEIFYRKASLVNTKPTHPANQPIKNKNQLTTQKESCFTYDLIKDKRYTQNKYFFHVPITLNFKSRNEENINPLVNDYIRTSEELHIIGIDRGERHLLYVSVIDLKGNIKKQFSLNEIINEHNGVQYTTNYHALLEKREEERMEARKDWQKIENIKDLKEGYLSQVVHKICQLVVEYNAIVVLEDLNIGFKRGRQKVELSVYQKFEKMLIDKLNYLVDKKKQPNDLGGVLNALQLTNKFISFAKLGKQSGILFYTQAWNTSKIDPVTGFVNLFDTRYETIDKAKQFFSRFDDIRFNNKKNWFEFDFDYNNFTNKARGSITKWTICSVGDRIKNHRDPTQNNHWTSTRICLTSEFKNLFDNFDININSNLKDAIVSQNSKEFFEKLLSLLRLTLQIRNSEIKTQVDYMQSPVADENGCFYNSKVCGNSLPENADANGAYNIARKGIWIVQRIKESDPDKKLNLAITNQEWLEFAQTKPYLK